MTDVNRRRIGGACVLSLVIAGCNGAQQAPPPTPIANTQQPPPPVTPPSASAPVASSLPTLAPAPPEISAKSVDLPGATAPVTLDLIAYDPAAGRVWVPVGDTGSVDVFEIAAGAFKRVDGFKTVEREMNGHKRAMGPSSVTIGAAVAYVGTRSTSEVCAVDEKSLKLGKCSKLASPPDFVTFVALAKEVWVTTPRAQSIAVLDASKPTALKSKLSIKAPGAVEGAVVDADHHLYYTNLEDKNQTLAIDIESHTIKTTWSPGCGEGGPHGIAVDSARNFVFVACSDGVRILDAAHDGATLGKLDAGDGVDDITYDASRQLLYVAAAKAHRLTIARVDEKARATVIATGATGERGRNAVADTAGNVYVADAGSAKLLIFGAPSK